MSFRNINSNFLFTNYHKPNHKKIVLKKKLTLLNQNKILHINAKKTTKIPNKWIILLTMAVNVNGESEYRKQLYKTQILNWLKNTSYYIYAVESTGVDLNITHERLKFISFELPKLASSSQSEATSMLYLLDQIKDDANFIDCTHILKVTGRYFLQNINNVLNGCIHNLDAYLQHHYNHVNRWQNTEYYGIRKSILKNFLLTVLNEGLIENKIYDFTFKNKLTFARIGPFKNNIERGGDKLVIPYL
jgi:hypothetical protein